MSDSKSSGASKPDVSAAMKKLQEESQGLANEHQKLLNEHQKLTNEQTALANKKTLYDLKRMHLEILQMEFQYENDVYSAKLKVPEERHAEFASFQSTVNKRQKTDSWR